MAHHWPAQRASYLALHSSLFGPVAQLIMIILSLTALTLQLIGSRCILNGAHTNHVWANLAQASKLIKTLVESNSFKIVWNSVWVFLIYSDKLKRLRFFQWTFHKKLCFEMTLLVHLSLKHNYNTSGQYQLSLWLLVHHYFGRTDLFHTTDKQHVIDNCSFLSLSIYTV